MLAVAGAGEAGLQHLMNPRVVAFAHRAHRQTCRKLDLRRAGRVAGQVDQGEPDSVTGRQQQRRGVRAVDVGVAAEQGRSGARICVPVRGRLRLLVGQQRPADSPPPERRIDAAGEQVKTGAVRLLPVVHPGETGDRAAHLGHPAPDAVPGQPDSALGVPHRLERRVVVRFPVGPDHQVHAGHGSQRARRKRAV
jgi:hypothetical protein